MEESINTSEDEEPITVSKSRERRIQRRKHLNCSDRPSNKIYLEEECKKEKEETNSAFAIEQTVVQFSDEMFMVAGDQYEKQWPATTLLTQLNIPVGFHRCDQLPMPKTPPPYLSLADPESPNDITESELLQVCELAEAKISKLEFDIPLSSSLPPPTSPPMMDETPPQNEKQKTKSIVELILEDFCSSPSANETPPPIELPESEAIVFRFRNTQIHTYASKRRTSTNEQSTSKKFKIAQQLEERFEPQNVGRNSRSSSLSEQEDLPPEPLPICPIGEDLCNSQQLTDNLLILSAFFGSKTNDSTTSIEDKTELNAMQSENSLNSIQMDTLNNSIRMENSNTSTSTEIFFTPESGDNEEIQNTPNAVNSQIIEMNENDEWFEAISKISVLINEILDKQKALNSNSYQPIGSENNFRGFALKADSTNTDVNDKLTSIKHDLIELDDFDEWNDDCSFLTDFKTEDIFGLLKKENNTTTVVETDLEKRNENAALQEIETNALANIQFSEWFYNETENDNCIEDTNASEHDTTFIKSHEDLTTETKVAENIGFQTANKKSITVTEEAKTKAARILEDLPIIPISKVNSENKAKNADVVELSNDFVLDKIGKVTDGLIGFKTAGKKAIKVTEEAKIKAARLLEDIPDIPIAKHKLHLKETKAENSEKEKQKTVCCVEEKQQIPDGPMGFFTASKKSIKVSEEAKMKAARLLEDLPDISTTSEAIEFVTPKAKNADYRKNLHGSEKEMTSKQTTKKSVSFLEEIHKIPDVQVQSVGFQTASRRPVNVSEKAQHIANRLIQDLMEDNLPTCSNVAYNNYPEGKKTIMQTSISKEQRIEKIIDIPFKNNTRNTEKDSDKSVENDIKPKSPHSPAINCSKVSTPMSANKMRANSIDFLPSMTTASEESKHIKSKLDNDGLNATETPQRNGNKYLLCKSLSSNNLEQRMPLNRIDNGGQNGAKSAVILRKNLLSLTRRKKVNVLSASPLIETTNSVAQGATVLTHDTPIKPSLKLNDPHSPATPCLKEFFDAVESASTPQRLNPFSSATPNDVSGLQRIQWDINDSTASRDDNRSNVKSNSKQPTPKQRIARLSMYGKPPPVSPISMLVGTSSNTCRPSGLRRRSARQIVINQNKQ